MSLENVENVQNASETSSEETQKPKKTRTSNELFLRAVFDESNKYVEDVAEVLDIQPNSVAQRYKKCRKMIPAAFVNHELPWKNPGSVKTAGADSLLALAAQIRGTSAEALKEQLESSQEETEEMEEMEETMSTNEIDEVDVS